MNIALIITIGVLVYFTFSGYRRGFVRLILSILSIVFTSVFVWIVSPGIANYLVENTGMYTAIKNNIDNSLSEENSRRDNTVYENQIETINSYAVPDLLKAVLAKNNNEETYQNMSVNIFEDYISGFLARLIIRVLAFVCTYLLIMIILKMTILSMDFVTKLPVINGINKNLGFLFGFIEGLCICWIGFMVATVFIGDAFMNMVHSNGILNFLYTNNIILRMIAG